MHQVFMHHPYLFFLGLFLLVAVCARYSTRGTRKWRQSHRDEEIDRRLLKDAANRFASQ